MSRDNTEQPDASLSTSREAADRVTDDATAQSQEPAQDTISAKQLEAMDEQALDEAGYVKVDLSKLPKINWGALFMPAIWGPAHGQWLTILFYPIWIFADTCFVNAIFHGGVFILFALLVFLGTAAVTIFYARTAGQKAYVRVAHKMSLERYLKRERIWALVSACIALVFIGLATWYNLTFVLPAGPVG